ncbi:ATPase inhibitor subunit zeta [Sinorhizobium fredii]|uniref:ATPase inhibitor subunit zeta n=1 Tax=Rhizobium fredii TaxID=380 RepID=UPI0035193324
MAALTNRERVLEEKYIRDFERSMKVRERRNRLLAKWAVHVLGRTDAEAYMEEVIAAGRVVAGDDDVLRKILQDFDSAHVPASEEKLREKMHVLLFVAAEQLDAEE